MKTTPFSITQLSNLSTKACFICKKSIPPHDIIFEDDQFIAFLDLYPPTKGYTLLAPKDHYQDITDLTAGQYAQFQKLLYKISKAIKISLQPNRICLLNSGGLVPHWHFHIIPVYEKVKDNFVDYIMKTEILEMTDEERKETSTLIRQSFNNG